MNTNRTPWLPTPIFFCLSVALLALASARVSAADADEATRKSTDSYVSGDHKINYMRFELACSGTHPAVLLLHGADGPDANAATYSLLARRLAKKGYVVFVVRYFDAFADRPKELAFFQANIKDYLKIGSDFDGDRIRQTFQECLTVVCDGVKHVCAQPGVDKERVGLVGFSLGAFLALSAATRDELKIAAVVDLFGGLPEELNKHAQTLPPVLILHGDRDQTVAVDAAHRLERLLKDKQIAHEIQVYKGVGHVFANDKGGVCWDAALDAEKRATAFLDKHLQRPDAKTLAPR